jgi:predicted metal-dependent hydrolase
MKEGMGNYDDRYLAGIQFFNARDFFEAHEVWEDLWADSHGDERRFYQGLIQAAVALFHYSGGNLRGAQKLYATSREYMRPCGSPFLGLDAGAFWRQMEACFEPLWQAAAPEATVRPDPARLPVLTLDPPPASWPDRETFLPAED